MADNQGLFAITAEQREELQGWAQSGRLRQTGPSANDELADWSRAYQLFRGNVAYVWHAGVHAAEVARGLEAAGAPHSGANRLGQTALRTEPW